jgi:hypothetical protein
MRRIDVWVVAFGLFCLVLEPSCTDRDEADRVRRLIDKGARLAEEHDVGGLLELTTEGFLALPGNRDRAEVRGILWMAFRHYREFKILYPVPTVDLEEGGENAASATVYFLIVRKERSYPELKDLYGDPRGWLEAVGENADLYRLKRYRFGDQP